MSFCKKIDGKYYCMAKNRRHMLHCEPGQLDQHDDWCQFWSGIGNVCNIGRLIEIDQKTQDADAIY